MQWLSCKSETEPPASLPLAGSQFCGAAAAAAVLRGLSEWHENLSSVSLGIAHSFFMFSACWHKFFLSHSLAFTYLKYHNKTGFKMLSLIPKILLLFVFPQPLFPSYQILLLSVVGCYFSIYDLEISNPSRLWVCFLSGDGLWLSSFLVVTWRHDLLFWHAAQVDREIRSNGSLH